MHVVDVHIRRCPTKNSKLYAVFGRLCHENTLRNVGDYSADLDAVRILLCWNIKKKEGRARVWNLETAKR